ncbi:MAG: hypothetical protein KF681_03955 [Bdellovibrionaceae bacterium]|nr:hypothetical protein [Pseudobdellovibrionaceae bacterium]
MKLMASAIVTLFAAAAFANPAAPAAKTTTTSTTTTTATTADAHADAKKACEGKMGEELKKCETEFKKTHKK